MMRHSVLPSNSMGILILPPQVFFSSTTFLWSREDPHEASWTQLEVTKISHGHGASDPKVHRMKRVAGEARVSRIHESFIGQRTMLSKIKFR